MSSRKHAVDQDEPPDRDAPKRWSKGILTTKLKKSSMTVDRVCRLQTRTSARLRTLYIIALSGMCATLFSL